MTKMLLVQAYLESSELDHGGAFLVLDLNKAFFEMVVTYRQIFESIKSGHPTLKYLTFSAIDCGYHASDACAEDGQPLNEILGDLEFLILDKEVTESENSPMEEPYFSSLHIGEGAIWWSGESDVDDTRVSTSEVNYAALEQLSKE